MDDGGTYGAQFVPGAIFCGRCGCQTPARWGDPAQGFACPSCRQLDRVQRVSGGPRLAHRAHAPTIGPIP